MNITVRLHTLPDEDEYQHSIPVDANGMDTTHMHQSGHSSKFKCWTIHCGIAIKYLTYKYMFNKFRAIL